MNRIVARFFLVFLSLSVVFSCSTQRRLFFARETLISANSNSIESDGRTFLRVDPCVLNLAEKRLTVEKDILSKAMKSYLYSILQECHSSRDTMIAASRDFIVLKNVEINQKPDANYIYSLNFDDGRWVCQYIDALAGDTPLIGETCSWFRKVYVVKRKNRVMVKDYFGGIAVIYVIQGKDKKTDFFTTSVWNPTDFPTLITTTNYIRERIDPISQDIAKSKYLNQKR